MTSDCHGYLKLVSRRGRIFAHPPLLEYNAECETADRPHPLLIIQLIHIIQKRMYTIIRHLDFNINKDTKKVKYN